MLPVRSGVLLHAQHLFACLWIWSTVAKAAQIVRHNASFTPDTILRVTARNTSIGGISRLSTVVNGTIPGPEIRMQEGQAVWIRVHNDLKTDNLTMHWHGLAQAASPFSDGTPLTSQWPIPPGAFFDYELQIPRGTAGTYFYHSHIGFQALTAAGPLIVEEAAAPPYKYDGERTFFLQELYNKSDTAIKQGLLATPFVWSGETNGFMVNGKTISNYNITDVSSKKLAVFNVKPGKTYRFRFIGAHALSYTVIGIEKHQNLTLIEADGSYTQRHRVDNIQLGNGQRYSALLTTQSCDSLLKSKQLDYYIQLESRDRPTIVVNYAVLRYNSTCEFDTKPFKKLSLDAYPANKTIYLPKAGDGYLDYTLRPLVPNNFPSAAKVSRRVIIDVQQMRNNSIIWQDAKVSWLEHGENDKNQTIPTMPYLVALYEGGDKFLPSYDAAVTNGGADPRTHTFPAKIGEIIDIVFQNVGAHTFDGSTGGGLDSHPFHAHGSHYYDIGGGPGTYDPVTAERRLNGTQPVLRDTTMLYRYNATTTQDGDSGWRAWRLRVEQPGAWMIHCHSLQHMLMGMQTVWVFGDKKDIMTLPKPLVAGYLAYGGDAYGNKTHAPQVVEISDVNNQPD